MRKYGLYLFLWIRMYDGTGIFRKSCDGARDHLIRKRVCGVAVEVVEGIEVIIQETWWSGGRNDEGCAYFSRIT